MAVAEGASPTSAALRSGTVVVLRDFVWAKSNLSVAFAEKPLASSPNTGVSLLAR